MKTRQMQMLLLLPFFLLIALFLPAQTDPDYSYDIDAEYDVSLGYSYGDSSTVLETQDMLYHTLPLMRLNLSVETSDALRAEIEATLVPEYGTSDTWSFAPAFGSANPIPLENNIITLGILQLPLPGGSVTMGRQNIHFGPGRHSLMISEDLPYFDGISWNIRLGSWEMKQLVATLENRRTDYDPTLSTTFAPDSSLSGGYGYEETIILLSSRRFSWNTEKLELGIGAQAVLTRVNNAFAFGDILPVFSIHNSDVGNNNLEVILDALWRPSNYHEIYAAYGFDDINAEIVGIEDAGIPLISAGMLGYRGQIHLGRMPVSVFGDLTSTHYMWGSFENEYYLSRAIYRLYTDGDNIALPLSSPYGPGKTSLETGLETKVFHNLTLNASLLALWGDPDISLFSNTYSAGLEYNPSFELFRASIQGTWSAGMGLNVGFTGLLDITSTETYPVAGITIGWSTGSY